MDINKSFGFDHQLAENGTWHDLPDGGRAKVAKLGNSHYKAEIVRLQKPVLAILRSTKIDNRELIDSITIKAMARAILNDWSNISIDSEEIPYSYENAVLLLTDYPVFLETISELAIDLSNFQAEAVAGK